MTGKQPAGHKPARPRSDKTVSSPPLGTMAGPSIPAAGSPGSHAGGHPFPRSGSPAPPDGGHPVTIEVMVRFQAIALPEADGGYSVLIPALGCATEGDTVEEAQAHVVEAAEGWLASMHDRYRDGAIRVSGGEEG